MIFSVVVPFLNEEKLIEKCVKSLLQQEFDQQKYELIFIDNGSTDHSTDIVRNYHNITLLYEPQQDPYLARNRGIRAAQGQFIVFTDADCVADCHWLAELWHTLEESNADIVLGRLLYPTPASIFLQCYEHYYHTKIIYLLYHELRQCYYGHAGNMVVRASIFDEVGLFASMPVVGDTEIIHRFMQHNPDIKISYAQHAKIAHAEVTHFRYCLHKLFQYGQYSETYNKMSTYRPLHFKEKLHVFKVCFTEQHYGPGLMLISGGTLFVGWLSFEAGRWLRWLQTHILSQV